MVFPLLLLPMHPSHMVVKDMAHITEHMNQLAIDQVLVDADQVAHEMEILSLMIRN